MAQSGGSESGSLWIEAKVNGERSLPGGKLCVADEVTTKLFLDSHKESLERDRGDITKNTQAMGDDREGIKTSRDSMSANNQIINDLLQHGHVRPESIERRRGMLAGANDSDKTDIQGSQEYSGTQPPDAKAVANGIQQAKSIDTLAKELGSGNVSEERRTAILSQMLSAATDIEKLGVGDKSIVGKDVTDAGKEASTLSSDVRMLQSIGPYCGDSKYLVDIRSKAGLITRELGDIKDEQGYIAHDRRDMASNDAVAATLDRLPTSGHLPWAQTAELINVFQQDNQSKRETIGLRREDLKAEPAYNRADTTDIHLNQQLMRDLDKNIYK
jgi:hypothetical protein